MIYFNPRSPHGERRLACNLRRIACDISIHAPRTGSDRTPCSSPATRPYFNPRSPHGERPCPFRACARLDLFQSTLPARGATCRAKFASQSRSRFQSTLPARGATTRGCRKPVRRVDISIHAPRTGSDGPPGRTTALRSDFNPRSPHGERRSSCSGTKPVLIYFNPRSPHGERRAVVLCVNVKCTFQSTLPARGATDTTFFGVCPTSFQSTLPARGATCKPIYSDNAH